MKNPPGTSHCPSGLCPLLAHKPCRVLSLPDSGLSLITPLGPALLCHTGLQHTMLFLARDHFSSLSLCLLPVTPMLASSYSAHVSVKHPSLHVHVKAVTRSLSARMALINFKTLGGIWYFSIIDLFNCLQELSSLPRGASCLSGPPLRPRGQRGSPHKGAQWTPAKGRTPLHSKGLTYDLWRLRRKTGSVS